MPDLIYNVKFNIEDNLQEGVAGAERFEQEIKDLEQEVLQLRASLEAAGNEAGELGTKTKGTTSNLGAMNKQTAIGNQLFFSLSDGLQDSAQFSQGFSTGMRAIGNNIGFTAELGAVFLQQVREQNKGMLTFRKVAKAAGKSLMGPGGFILAVNAAVLILTALSRKQNEASKKAKELASELSGKLKSSLDDYVNVMLDAEGNTFSLNEALEDVQQELDKNLISMSSLTRATNSQTQASQNLSMGQRMLAEANTIQTATSSRAQNVANMNIVSNTKFLGITDEIREALADKIEKEIESNKVNELFLDLLKEVNPEYERYTSQVESVTNLVTEKNAREVDAALGTNLAQMSQAEFNSAVQQAITDIESLNITTQERIRLLNMLTSVTGEASEEEFTISRDESFQDRFDQELDYARRQRAAIREQNLLILKNEELTAETAELIRVNRMKKLEDSAAFELMTEQEIAAAKLDINLQYQEDLASIEDMEMKATKAKFDAFMRLVSGVSSAIQAVFGESKAVAIAEATINTFLAMTKARAMYAPPIGGILAAAELATGIATVANIAKTEPGGSSLSGGGGGGSASTGISVTDVGGRLATATPFGEPDYTPRDRGAERTPVFKNEVLATPKQLYIITRNGEKEIGNSQV